MREKKGSGGKVKSSTVKQELVDIFRSTKGSLTAFVRTFIVSKQDYVPSIKFHEKIGEFLLYGKGSLAIEAFRESAKTTYVVYGFPLYCLTFPDYSRSYIVLFKASDDLAKQKLKDIRDMYFGNKLLSANVQKVYQQGEVLDILTKEGVRIRIEAYGKGANARGLTWMSRRPDIVIPDDVQTTEDVRSDTIADRDWNWFLSDIYMLSKTSRIFMIGNNLGAKCIIERLSKNAKKFGFRFYRVPAIADGKSVWPAKFSLQDLMAEREAYRAAGHLDVWLRERMCLSVDEETAIFRKSDFRYYHKLPGGKINFFTAVDLASSRKKGADYTVVMTIGVNSDNIVFVDRADYGRFKLSEAVDTIFSHVEQYKPIKVGIETVAFQAMMVQVLQAEMLKRNIFFSIEEIQQNRGNMSKEDRIMTLQPRYNAHTIYHKQDAPYLEELETELVMFSREGAKSEHDDMMDALEMAVRIAYRPVVKKGVQGELQKMAIML